MFLSFTLFEYWIKEINCFVRSNHEMNVSDLLYYFFMVILLMKLIHCKIQSISFFPWVNVACSRQFGNLPKQWRRLFRRWKPETNDNIDKSYDPKGLNWVVKIVSSIPAWGLQLFFFNWQHMHRMRRSQNINVKYSQVPKLISVQNLWTKF